MTAISGTTGRRWTAARKIAAYGAAAAMLPYFVIKIFWTVDGLLGGGLRDGVWSSIDWGLINALTVAMSGMGIVLGLALAQPWGMRVPAWSLLLPAWTAMGFLVSMALILPARFLTELAGWDAGTASAALPEWELTLIGLAFAGFALGIAVAAPAYAAQRWPVAFVGTVGGSAARPVERAAAGIAVAICVGLAAPQAYWASGGTLGLDPAGLARRDLSWHLITANNALWAVVAAWGVWTLTRRRQSRLRIWIPVMLAWVASGSLFAWGTWKATFFFATATVAPEYPLVRGLQNHLGAVAGVLIGMVLLVVLHDRGRVPATITPVPAAPRTP